MRKLFFLAGSLLAAAGTVAQTPTNVIGTITDPNGLPYNTGTIRADLIPAGGPQPCAGSNPCQTFQSGQQATLSSTGSFQMNLYPNSIITPAGTQWQFTVTEPGVDPPFGFGPVTFIYVVSVPQQATFDISSGLSALAPAMARAQSGPGTFPRYDQILNPNASYSNTFGVGITGTYTGGGTISFAGINFILPAGCTAASANGNICYDSSGNLHVFNAGSDTLLPGLPPSFPVGDVLLGGAGGTFGDGGPLTSPVGTTVASYTPVGIQANDVLAFDSTGALFNFTIGFTPVNISTSSYSYVGTERRELLFYSASGAKTAALPQASEATAFNANWDSWAWNTSTSGNLVITVSTSLFSLYNSTTSSTLTITPGSWCRITSDSSANSGNGFYYPICAADPAVVGSGFITGTLTAGIVPVASGTNAVTNGSILDDGTHAARDNHGFDVNSLGAYNFWALNNASPGTVSNLLACDDGTGKVRTCSHTTTATNNPIGIAVTLNGAAPGTTGSTGMCWLGFCTATFDATATANDFAQMSTTVDGEFHDVGASAPTNGQSYWHIYTGCTGAACAGVLRTLSADELNAASISGNSKGLSGMTSGQVAIAGSAKTITSSVPLQGTDTSILTSGTISGSTGVALCTDAQHGATTSGCAAGGITSINTATGPAITIAGAGSAGVTQAGNTITVTGINGPPSPTVNNTSSTSYTVSNSDNSWREKFFGGDTAVTQPQAGSIAVSPFIGSKFATTIGPCTSCATTSFSQSSGDNLQVGIAYDSATITVTNVTDSAGDTFTRVVSDNNNVGSDHANMSWWRANGIVASGSNTVTVTISSTATIGVFVQEYNTVSNDASNVQNATTGTLASTIPISFTNVVTLAAYYSFNVGCPSGWTSRVAIGVSAGKQLELCEKLLQSVATSTFVYGSAPGNGAILAQADYAIASSPQFTAGWYNVVESGSSGNAHTVITPTTSTINSQTTLDVVQNEWCAPMSDGANYNAICGFLPNLVTNGVMGGAVEVGSLIQNARASDQTTQTFYTTRSTSNGTYLAEVAITCTSAVSGVYTFTLGWTDTGSQAQTQTATANCTTLGASSFGSISLPLRIKSSTGVTWALSHTGSQPTADVSISLLQVHTQ